MLKPVHLQLLGNFRLLINGREVTSWRSRNLRWLLGILAIRAGETVDRSWLAGTLWPNSTEQQALANLRLNLSYVRTALGEYRTALTQTGSRVVSLDAAVCSCDALQLMSISIEGSELALHSATKLYNGELMPGCEIPWVLAQRSRLETNIITCVRRLATMQMSSGKFGVAIDTLDWGLQVDPYDENLMRMLMECHISTGDSLHALVAYRTFRARILRDLNLDVGSDIKQLAAFAQTTAHDPYEIGTPTICSPAAATFTMMPGAMPTIYGRENELRVICAKLKQHRLITLTGSGGVGKTRLAIEAAHQIPRVLGIPVYIIELASVSEFNQILPAAIRALGLFDDHSAEPEQRIVSSLSGKAAVLIFDNCEQIIEDAAAVIKSLLGKLPLIRILSTSRRPLGIAEEWRLRVHPLSLPAEDTSSLESIVSNSSAVKLFIERASMADGEFRVCEDNILEIVSICQKLEGIPLAIEMAAARTAHLSLSALSSNIAANALTELDLQDSTRPMRHRTMNALIEWTYNLLNEQEKSLLGYLALFAGPFHLEHLGSIAEQAGTNPSQVARALYSLTDWSLVRMVNSAGETCYVLQEPVKLFVRNKLVTSACYKQAMSQFIEVLRSFSTLAASELRGHHQALWLDRLETEHTNYVAILTNEISEEPQDPARLDSLTEIAWNLTAFWESRGYLTFARSVLTALNASTLSADLPNALIKVQLALLKIAIARGDTTDADDLVERASQTMSAIRGRYHEPMLAYLSVLRENLCTEQKLAMGEKCLAVANECGDEYHEALTLSLMAHEYYRARLYEESEACLRQAWRKSHSIGDLRNAARVQTVRGNLEWARGHRSSAISQYYTPALATYRLINDPRGMATNLMNIAAVKCELGQFAEAEALYLEAELLHKRLQRTVNAIYCKNLRACVQLSSGTRRTAKQLLLECLFEARNEGDEILVAECIADLCQAALRDEDVTSARILYGAIQAITTVDVSWHKWRAGLALAVTELNADNYHTASEQFKFLLAELNIWNDDRFNLTCYLYLILASTRASDAVLLRQSLKQAQSLHWLPPRTDIGSNYDMFELLGKAMVAMEDYDSAVTVLALADQLRNIGEIHPPHDLAREHQQLIASAEQHIGQERVDIALLRAKDVQLINSSDIGRLFSIYLNMLDQQCTAPKARQ